MIHRHTMRLILLAFALFLLAGQIQNPLLSARRMTTTQADPVAVHSSPLMTFLPVALGGFRGIMADVFWLRLTILQDEGSYLEIMQLADWITALIPHAPEVWSYQSWNMAFNISSAMHNNWDRWLWVRRGLDLLMHEAMGRSPDKPKIQLEIGRIYHHKIASTFDRTHAYYQQQLAKAVSQLLPDGCLSQLGTNSTTLTTLWIDFRLDRASMKRVEELYGTLDWRLASSHAIYWGYRASESINKTDALNGDRLVYQSLSDQFRRGTIQGDIVSGDFTTSPDLTKFEVCKQAYETAIRRHHANDTTAGYVNFLKTAVRLFYAAGRETESRTTFEDLVSRFPERLPGVTFEDLVRSDKETP